MKLEICIDSYESFLNAKKAGVDRVEICQALELDGLSPSVGLVSMIEDSDLEKFVMIRPRSGDFFYCSYITSPSLYLRGFDQNIELK